MMRVVIYTRVSTEDQTDSNQKRDLQAYLKRRADLKSAQWISDVDSAYSKRPSGIPKLLAMAQRREYDVLLVWALDRLTRGGALETLNLIDKLKHFDVTVISLQEPWTEAPGDLADILYSITGWVARMESKRRSERTKAGLARAKANGVQLGRRPGSKDKRKRKTSGYHRRYAE